jgi:spoIIIJ-associated protein
MEGFKEFQGKDLDEAIKEACEYYHAAREKLEIDIIQDAKSGIFGIVGARKAKIQARRALLRETVEDILGRREAVKEEKKCPCAGTEAKAKSEAAPQAVAENAKPRPEKEIKPRPAPAPRAEKKNPEPTAAPAPTLAPVAEQAQPEAAQQPQQEEAKSRMPRRRPERAPRPERAERPERRKEERQPRPIKTALAEEGDEPAQEGFRILPLEELDAEKLRAVSLEVVGRLIAPVVGEIALTMELTDNRVNVMVDCGDDSGLLIGREGQTLASLQYLASRIVSRTMDAAVRVHLDAGSYRQRQDDKLREMALALAEKVRTSGRSYSTRPLSSYHRRIVHVALQECEDLQTRSSGDGAMKRVVILRKKVQ